MPRGREARPPRGRSTDPSHTAAGAPQRTARMDGTTMRDLIKSKRSQHKTARPQVDKDCADTARPLRNERNVGGRDHTSQGQPARRVHCTCVFMLLRQEHPPCGGQSTQQLSLAAELPRDINVFTVLCLLCMFEGGRDLWIKMLTNNPELHSLANICHWRHSETARSIAQWHPLQSSAASQGSCAQVFCRHAAACLAKSAAGIHQPTISAEGSCTYCRAAPSSAATSRTRVRSRRTSAARSSRWFIQRLCQRWSGTRSTSLAAPFGVLGDKWVWTFGTHWTEEESVTMSLQAKHPFDGAPVFFDGLVFAVFQHDVEKIIEVWKAKASNLMDYLHLHPPLARRRLSSTKKGFVAPTSSLVYPRPR